MRRAVLSVLAALALVCWLQSTEAPLPPSKGAGQPLLPRDVQDLVFFAESRPRLIRFHIRADGRPFREAWDQFLGRLFQHLDRDGDGVLNQAEIDRAPEPQFFVGLLRGNIMESQGMMMADSRKAPEMTMKLVPGKVTRQGLARY